MAEHGGNEPPAERADLAEMIGPFVRALIQDEQPVLDQHGLSMWGYTVLAALGNEPIRTQAALAAAIGADKTRIIGTLDTLQDRGLIRREPDPADRRARLVAITDDGRRIRDAARAQIQRSEEWWLAHLEPGDRSAFLRALQTLARVAADAR